MGSKVREGAQGANLRDSLGSVLKKELLCPGCKHYCLIPREEDKRAGGKQLGGGCSVGRDYGLDRSGYGDSEEGVD
jgi:hypothetical protein